jgi:hypothetical protein
MKHFYLGAVVLIAVLSISNAVAGGTGLPKFVQVGKT